MTVGKSGIIMGFVVLLFCIALSNFEPIATVNSETNSEDYDTDEVNYNILLNSSVIEINADENETFSTNSIKLEDIIYDVNFTDTVRAISPVTTNSTISDPSISTRVTTIKGEAENKNSVLDENSTKTPSLSSISVPSTFGDISTTEDITHKITEIDKCLPDHCNYTLNECTFTKPRGCIQLKEWVTHKVFVSKIYATLPSSVIYVKVIYDESDSDGKTTIELKECGQTKLTWTLSRQKVLLQDSYVTSGPNLTLVISVRGSVNAVIHYIGVEHISQVVQIDNTADSGSLTPVPFENLMYRPNTNTTYLFTPSKDKWNESSVLMTVSFVDLDEATGEYLLIGAGKKAFAGPEPLFLSGSMKQNRKYYIANEKAYVIVISKYTQRKELRGFHIEWERSGTLITKPDEELEKEEITPDSVEQSAEICFYNSTFIKQLNTTEDFETFLKPFQDKLASVANTYAKQHMPLDTELPPSSVELLRISSMIDPNDLMPEGGVYAMVTIVFRYEKKMAVFRRRQLVEIIEQLEKEDEKAGYPMLGFKVGQCPESTHTFNWYLVATLLIIISTTVLVIVWAYSSISRWRNYSRQKKFPKVSFNGCRTDSNFRSQENTYVKYNRTYGNPILTVDTCDFEKDSKSAQDRRDDDDESDIEVFNDNWLMIPTLNPLTLTTTVDVHNDPKRSNLETFAAPLPAPREKGSKLLWKDVQMDTLLPRVSEQSDNHEYDSLIFPTTKNPSNDMEREGDTKL